MALSERDIKLIERHLMGLLTSEEKTALKERQKDPPFKEELELYLQIKKSSTEIARAQLKKDFKIWDAEDATQHKSNIGTSTWWKIAAGVAILLGLIALLNIFLGPPSPQDLFAQYYEPYANLLDPIEKGGEPATASISQLYELGRHEEVVAHAAPDSMQAFYVALSRIALNDRDGAISTLEKFASQKTYRFKDAAQWYLALVFLKNDQVNRCRHILEEISSAEIHDFRELALDLLDELED